MVDADGGARHRRVTASARSVGRGDLETVREMASLFSRVDQRRGGGHARMALVQYLTSDVATYLRGTYLDERVRQDMLSVASESPGGPENYYPGPTRVD